MTLAALIIPRLAKKYKFIFKEQLRPLYSVQAFKKKPRYGRANIVCLGNLASHVIICYPTRQV